MRKLNIGHNHTLNQIIIILKVLFRIRRLNIARFSTILKEVPKMTNIQMTPQAIGLLAIQLIDTNNKLITMMMDSTLKKMNTRRWHEDALREMEYTFASTISLLHGYLTSLFSF